MEYLFRASISFHASFSWDKTDRILESLWNCVLWEVKRFRTIYVCSGYFPCISCAFSTSSMARKIRAIQGNFQPVQNPGARSGRPYQRGLIMSGRTMSVNHVVAKSSIRFIFRASEFRPCFLYTTMLDCLQLGGVPLANRSRAIGIAHNAKEAGTMTRQERLMRLRRQTRHLEKDLIKDVIPNGWELVAWSNYSSHKNDWFLFRVMCKRSDGKEFVTWIANVQTGECASGNYFRSEALTATDFAQRCGKEAALESLSS